MKVTNNKNIPFIHYNSTYLFHYLYFSKLYVTESKLHKIVLNVVRRMRVNLRQVRCRMFGLLCDFSNAVIDHFVRLDGALWYSLIMHERVVGYAVILWFYLMKVAAWKYVFDDDDAWWLLSLIQVEYTFCFYCVMK